MRFLFLTIIICFSLFALEDATIPYTFTQNTAARSSEVNKNFDSLRVAHNRLVDSLDANFIRNNGTADKITIDTVISDSVYSDAIKTATITSDSARLLKIIADTIYSPKSKISILTSDSIYSTKIRSAGYGNISADSVYSTKINSGAEILVTSVAGSVSTPSGATAIYSKGAGASASLYVKGGDGVERSFGNYQSSSFLCTLSIGLTTQPVDTAYYTILDSIVYLSLPTLTGTSNSADMAFRIPAEISVPHANLVKRCLLACYDNGAYVLGLALFEGSGDRTISVINLNAASPNLWTASGTKGIFPTTITYSLKRQ